MGLDDFRFCTNTLLASTISALRRTMVTTAPVSLNEYQIIARRTDQNRDSGLDGLGFFASCGGITVSGRELH